MFQNALNRFLLRYKTKTKKTRNEQRRKKKKERTKKRKERRKKEERRQKRSADKKNRKNKKRTEKLQSKTKNKKEKSLLVLLFFGFHFVCFFITFFCSFPFQSKAKKVLENCRLGDFKDKVPYFTFQARRRILQLAKSSIPVPITQQDLALPPTAKKKAKAKVNQRRKRKREGETEGK